MAEAGVVDIARLLSGQGLDEAQKIIESGKVEFRVYALPRPRIRIRTPKKRLVELDEGKIARLEYALVRSVVSAATRGGKPIFEDFASLVGDYKAAAAYLASLWRLGIISISDDEAAANLYIAATALSQKTYEHRIARVRRTEFSVIPEKVAELPSDRVYCVVSEGTLGCRYLVANCARSQAKAEVRGVVDALKGRE